MKSKQIYGVTKPSDINDHFNYANNYNDSKIIDKWQQIENDLNAKQELGDLILSNYYETIYKYVGYLLSWNGRTKSTYFEDAVQEACIIFMDMLKTYDNTKNENPFLYARKRIQQRVSLTVNNYMYSCKDWESKTILNINKLLKQNPYVSIHEIADELNMSVDDVNHYMNTIKISSLDNEEFPEAADLSINVHDNVLNDIQFQTINAYIDKLLLPIEKKILYMMLGINSEKLPAKKIAAKLGTTTEQIYLYYHKILSKIRKDQNVIKLLKGE